MDIQKQLAEKLRAIKDYRGISLTEMAAELQISRSGLQKLLEGDGNPSIQTLEHISERLNCPPEALIGGADDQPRLRTSMLMLQVLDEVSRLDHDKQREFAELFTRMIDLWKND